SSPESGALRWRHYAENTRLLYGERQHPPELAEGQAAILRAVSGAFSVLDQHADLMGLCGLGGFLLS
uniref:hypothetical protein n=1 Tax=Caballeronia sp. AZ10_KS36 TaxID=2921757 RepID=UPI0020286EEE